MDVIVLKLNICKTERKIFLHPYVPSLDNFCRDWKHTNQSLHTRILGVMLGNPEICALLFGPHPNLATSTSVTFRKYAPSKPTTTKLVQIHSLVISHLYFPLYWLSLCKGIYPSIINAASRLTHFTNHLVSATFLCQSLNLQGLTCIQCKVSIVLLAGKIQKDRLGWLYLPGGLQLWRYGDVRVRGLWISTKSADGSTRNTSH